jgi:NAD(P)-dependent dehydrogenase (short-subunit alcohol dehydrogenase family)
MTKILLIGATGTIGQAIDAELQSDCDIIRIGNQSGDFQVDLADSNSIETLYQQHLDADAVVCAAARGVVLKAVHEIEKDDAITSIQSKLLGQIDLVTQGLRLLKDHVSFTLTTGILNTDPIATGSLAAMINGAVEAFAHAAAKDVPGKQRINVISPALLTESQAKLGEYFPGYETVAAAKVARAYRKAIFGIQSGRVFSVV